MRTRPEEREEDNVEVAQEHGTIERNRRYLARVIDDKQLTRSPLNGKMIWKKDINHVHSMSNKTRRNFRCGTAFGKGMSIA